MPDIAVSFKGPFFEPGLPEDAVNDAMRATIGELVAEGETDVKLQLYRGHGLLTGHYRNSVHGEVLNSRHGAVHDSRVIYGAWLEGTSSRNQTTRFKGYFMFRLAARRLQQKAQGIANKHFARAASRMN